MSTSPMDIIPIQYTMTFQSLATCDSNDLMIVFLERRFISEASFHHKGISNIDHSSVRLMLMFCFAAYLFFFALYFILPAFTLDNMSSSVIIAWIFAVLRFVPNQILHSNAQGDCSDMRKMIMSDTVSRDKPPHASFY